MSRVRRSLLAALAAGLMAVSPLSAAVNDQPSNPEIRLQDGRFQPAQLIVPAESSFKVKVTNRGPTAIEFESFELHRERVVQPGETITVYMPPLRAGVYRFFDDFNHGTPEGTIVAR